MKESKGEVFSTVFAEDHKNGAPGKKIIKLNEILVNMIVESHQAKRGSKVALNKTPKRPNKMYKRLSNTIVTV